MREESKTKWVVGILVVIILVLLGIVIYFIWAQPAYQSFITAKQVEGYNYGQTDVINAILVQIQQQGYVQIPVGNQTLYLAPFNPQQVAQQAASA